MSNADMITKQFAILDHMPTGAFVLQKDFVVIFWNSRLEDWTGVSRRKIIGKHIGTYFPHLNAPKYSTRIQHVFTNGTPVVFSSYLHKSIIPVTLPDDQMQIQSTTVTRVPALNGTDYYALFSIQDVTELTHRIRDYRIMRDQAQKEVKERKQAEAALQKAKDVTEEALHDTQLLYKTSRILAHTSDMQKGIEHVLGEYLCALNLKQGGISIFDFEQQYGTLYALYRNGQPQPPGLVVKNISQGHQQIIETGQPLAIYDVLNDPLLKANREMAIAHNVKSILLVPLIVRGQVIGLLGADSTERHRHFSDHELSLAQAIADQLATAIENTRLFEEEQRQRQAAEVANRAKSEFLANMSHELRTPLNAVLGYAQILQNAENLTTRQVEALKTIKSSGEHLLHLINDILDLSKIEAGRLELQVSEFHFPEFLKRIADMIRIRADQKGLKFVYEHAPDLPVGVRADEKKLQQVLLNLLGNAMKFTEQGSVTLKVTKVTKVTKVEDNNRQSSIVNLQFSIEDTGIGIASEKLEDIFLPFHQVGELYNKVDGTGLGLAISQRLVRIMGGELEVASTVGKGSTFWFELDLPIVDAGMVSPAKLSRKIIGYKGERRTVLVVDDTPENRAVLINMLLPLGFDVLEAVNGQECVEKAITFQPDMILLDLRMPVLDGFGATQRIREFENQKLNVECRTSKVERGDSEFPVSSFQFPVPIIAVSASVFETTRKRVLAIGFNDFLFKPFQLENLLELLHTYLQVEWRYEEVEEQPEVAFPTPPGPQPIVSLPSEEVNILLKLAERGNVKHILEQLNHTESLGKQFLPLVNELRTLAKSFQVDKIVENLEKMEEKTCIMNRPPS